MGRPNDGGAAFPKPMSLRDDGAIIDFAEQGMTLRDWFAGKAIPYVTQIAHVDNENASLSDMADIAYDLADAMLAAREKQKGEKSCER